jgi:O-antigen biosynthesis protein
MSKNNLLPIKTPVRIGFLSFLADQGGCGVLRTIDPYLLINQLKMDGVFFHATYLSQYVGDYNFYRNFSFIQFQRSATEQHLKIHRDFRANVKPIHKVPLIYEIDDMLMGIPEWNFAHAYYKENEKYIEAMMRESDAIVVSTPTLKKAYAKYNRNIDIVPNHLAKFIWGDIRPKHERYREEDRIRILWAGSQNHFKHPTMRNAPDGGDFGNTLMNFIRKTIDKYQWIMMGGMPIEFDDIRDKIEFHTWTNTWEYPNYVKSLNADIGIAPLKRCLFNDSKSNIKALEYTACGIPGVYSYADPYRNLTLVADTEEYMIDRIETLASDIALREEVWKKDYNIVKSQLWWEENDNLRKYVDTYLKLMNRRLPD